MRDIKFRGWHEDAKDMVYFELGANFIDCFGRDDNAHYVFDLEDGHPVMQYTGLKDKNGVEIYEGDIVEVLRECDQINFGDQPTKEVWEVNITTYGVMPIYCPAGINAVYEYSDRPEDIEILGNVYENPELLEERKVGIENG